MKLLVIHFSDIHFKADGENALLQKKEKLFDSLKNRIKYADQTLLVITGDIAYSGLKSEYIIADDFFTELIVTFEEYSGKSVSTFFVPGNHDCDFSISQSIRDNLLKSNISNPDKEIIDAFVSCQAEYRNFIDSFSEKPFISDQLFSKYKIVLDKFSIDINAFNTAFCSSLKEQEGTMFFPVNVVDSSIFSDRANLTISIFHHRPNWQNANSARKFIELLESTSDVILSGHEHVPKKSLLSDLENNFLLQLEGGALQDSSNSDVSEYNLLLFDMESEKYKIEKCRWENNRYVNNIEEREWISCKNQLVNNYDKLSFSDHHNDWLNDIGATFTHPVKLNLYLSDLYVEPNLKDISNDVKSDEIEDVISFDKVLKNVEENSKTIIIGDDKSGKTTLCKVVIKDLYKKGFYPIFIKGRTISSARSDFFLDHIKKSFYDQYKSKGYEFEEISTDKLYIIVDNFDRSNLNTKFKNKLLTEITNSFKNLFITGNDLIFIQELTNDEFLENSLLLYRQFEIQEFGHLLRYKLSDKWNTIGRTEIIDANELHWKNTEAERMINSIIGPNFIPAYPIFLLTILQTIEAGSPHDLKESSYGHYYQVLILSSLGKVVKENNEIDKYYTYLAEFSYWLFKGSSSEISLNEFQKFHEFHFTQYKVRMGLEHTLDILSKASIIEIYENSIAFKYPYVYYYFVAKYLADNLSNVEEKDLIKFMCRNLHKTHFANIILFLTHHTKDNIILDEIELVAKEQFKEFEIIKFDKDIQSFNDLIDNIPEIAYEQKSLNEHKEEVLMQKDELDSSLSNEKQIMDIQVNLEENETLDLLSRLNSAFKTLEILGQILKNHNASIKATKKIAFLKEAYNIGLRTLNSVFNALEASDDFLINQINDYVDKNNIKKDRYTQHAAGKKIVFNIGCHITYNFIKKITSSIGTVKLKEIYPELLIENPSNSYKLVDFVVRIEYINGFPITELKKLSEEFKANPLAYVTIRRAVFDYLYMYPLSVEKKQKISSILNISMNTQRIIEGKSKKNMKK